MEMLWGVVWVVSRTGKVPLNPVTVRFVRALNAYTKLVIKERNYQFYLMHGAQPWFCSQPRVSPCSGVIQNLDLHSSGEVFSCSSWVSSPPPLLAEYRKVKSQVPALGVPCKMSPLSLRHHCHWAWLAWITPLLLACFLMDCCGKLLSAYVIKRLKV